MSNIGFGEQEYVQNDDVEKFKLDKKERRISVVFRDMASAVKGCMTHSVGENAAYRPFRCLSTKDKKEECCTLDYAKNTPVGKFVVAIIEYNMVENEETGKMKVVGYKMLPWVFGPKVYTKLSSFHKKYNLAEVDLTVSLDGEAKFQQPNIMMEKENYWRGNEKLCAKVLAEYDKVIAGYEKKHLPPKKSLAEIRELLGVTTNEADYADNSTETAEFEV